MQLVINDVERDMLIRILESTVGDVRSQVRRTHNPEWHDGLKQDAVLLKGLIERLREPADAVDAK
jgi:hypothetical protein